MFYNLSETNNQVTLKLLSAKFAFNTDLSEKLHVK